MSVHTRLWSSKLLLTAALALSAATSMTRADEAPDWLEAARAACVHDYGETQCGDDNFVQERYNPATLEATREVARKASIRKHHSEERAMREVLVQHSGLCDQRPAQFCPPANLAACAEQLRQTCVTIKQQNAMCQAQTSLYCAQHSGSSQCREALKNQCGTGNQTVAQILARYPSLSPTQKAKIEQMATQLEANADKPLFGSIASTFLQLLGFGLY